MTFLGNRGCGWSGTVLSSFPVQTYQTLGCTTHVINVRLLVVHWINHGSIDRIRVGPHAYRDVPSKGSARIIDDYDCP